MLDLRLFDPTELARAEFIVLHSDHPLADQEQKRRRKFIISMNFTKTRFFRFESESGCQFFEWSYSTDYISGVK